MINPSRLISERQKAICRKTFEVLSTLNPNDNLCQVAAVDGLKLLKVIEEFEYEMRQLADMRYEAEQVILDKNKKIKRKNEIIEGLIQKLKKGEKECSDVIF